MWRSAPAGASPMSDDLNARMERLERSMQQLERRLERINQRLDGRRSEAPPTEDTVAALAGDEMIVRAYKLPDRVREQVWELMSRADVPVLVSPGQDEIVVHGNEAQQRAFRDFAILLAPGETEVRSLPLPAEKRDAVVTLLSKAAKVRAEGDAVRIEGDQRTLAAVTDFVKMIHPEEVTVNLAPVAGVPAGVGPGLTAIIQGDLGQRAHEYTRSAEELTAQTGELTRLAELLRSRIDQSVKGTDEDAKAALEDRLESIQNRIEEMRDRATDLNERARELEQRAREQGKGPSATAPVMSLPRTTTLTRSSPVTLLGTGTTVSSAPLTVSLPTTTLSTGSTTLPAPVTTLAPSTVRLAPGAATTPAPTR